MNADETYKNIIAKALRKTNEIFPLPNKLGIGRRYIRTCQEWPDPQDGNYQLLALYYGDAAIRSPKIEVGGRGPRPRIHPVT